MEITEDHKTNLIKATFKGVKNAFTGTNLENDFRIGAAVLTSSGKIFGAGQYVSDSYTLTIHAEQAAMVHAAANGEYSILAIMVGANETAFDANDGELIYPCHLCKQFVYESFLRSGVNTEFLILDKAGDIADRFKISEVMDKPWPSKSCVRS